MTTWAGELANGILALWCVNVLLQITVVASFGLIASRILHRDPVARYWLMCGVVLLILLIPCSSILLPAAGIRGFVLPLSGLTQFAGRHAPEDRAAVSLPRAGLDDGNQLLTPSSRAMAAEKQATLLPKPALAVSSTQSVGGAIIACLILPIWAIGSTILLIRHASGWRRIMWIERTAQLVSDPSLNRMLADAAIQLNSRQPRLFTSPHAHSPFVMGFYKPCLILPSGFAERMTGPQLRQIMIHEVAHVRRGDTAVVIIQNAFATLFWIHPLVWIINRQVNCAREEVCDNYVLLSTDPIAYGRTLLQAAEFSRHIRPLRFAVGAFTSYSQLEARVAGILSVQRVPITCLKSHRALLIATIVLVLGMTQALTTIAADQQQTVAPTVRDPGQDIVKQQPTLRFLSWQHNISDDAKIEGAYWTPDGKLVTDHHLLAPLRRIRGKKMENGLHVFMSHNDLLHGFATYYNLEVRRPGDAWVAGSPPWHSTSARGDEPGWRIFQFHNWTPKNTPPLGDIRLRYASGDDEVVATFKQIGPASRDAPMTLDYSVIGLGDDENGKAFVCLFVSEQALKSFRYYITATDIKGVPCHGHGLFSASGGKNSAIALRFMFSVPRSQIREYHLKRNPIREVVIRNVRLQPLGHHATRSDVHTGD